MLAYIRHLPCEHEYVNLEVEEIEEAIRREENPNLNPNSHSNPDTDPVAGGAGGDRSKKGKWGLVGELWWKGNRGRVLIGICLMIGQNFTGINGVNFYTPTIFKSIGFSGTKVVLLASGMFLDFLTLAGRGWLSEILLLTVTFVADFCGGVGMYAAVKTIATIISLVFFIDRLGRRKLLITSSIGTCLSLWYIGAFITAKHVDLKVEQEKSVAGWVAIVCVYIYAVSYSLPSSFPQCLAYFPYFPSSKYCGLAV